VSRLDTTMRIQRPAAPWSCCFGGMEASGSVRIFCLHVAGRDIIGGRLLTRTDATTEVLTRGKYLSGDSNSTDP